MSSSPGAKSNNNQHDTSIAAAAPLDFSQIILDEGEMAPGNLPFFSTFADQDGNDNGNDTSLPSASVRSKRSPLQNQQRYSQQYLLQQQNLDVQRNGSMGDDEMDSFWKVEETGAQATGMENTSPLPSKQDSPENAFGKQQQEIANVAVPNLQQEEPLFLTRNLGQDEDLPHVIDMRTQHSSAHYSGAELPFTSSNMPQEASQSDAASSPPPLYVVSKKNRRNDSFLNTLASLFVFLGSLVLMTFSIYFVVAFVYGLTEGDANAATGSTLGSSALPEKLVDIGLFVASLYGMLTAIGGVISSFAATKSFSTLKWNLMRALIISAFSLSCCILFVVYLALLFLFFAFHHNARQLVWTLIIYSIAFFIFLTSAFAMFWLTIVNFFRDFNLDRKQEQSVRMHQQAVLHQIQQKDEASHEQVNSNGSSTSPSSSPDEEPSTVAAGLDPPPVVGLEGDEQSNS